MTELSRRALFGAGLTRLARARADALASAVADPATSPREAAPRPSWPGDHQLRWLTRSASAAELLVDALEIRPGDRVLDITAATSEAVSAPAARRGAQVTAVDVADRLPSTEGGFDCVVSAFGVIHARDVRGVARELARVLRPGGRIGLATWSSAGAMGQVLRAARRGGLTAARRAHPERWGTYEGLQLALEAFPGFEVAEHSLSWRYPDRDALWGDLVDASALPPDVADELRSPLRPFVRDTDGEVELRVDWCLVRATTVQ